MENNSSNVKQASLISESIKLLSETSNSSLKSRQSYPIKQNELKQLYSMKLRQILQLPLQRQQYLKRVPLSDILKEPEFKFLFKKPDYLVYLSSHYSNLIEDQQLKQEIQKSRISQYTINGLTVVSLFTYIFSAHYLEKYSPFKGKLRYYYHGVIPGIIWFVAITRYKTINRRRRSLFEGEQNKAKVTPLVKKYLCETNDIERRKIIYQTQGNIVQWFHSFKF